MMTEATTDELETIVGAEEKYELVATYREKSSALGRGLTKGEVDLLTEWIEECVRIEKGIKKPSVHELTL